MAGWLAGWTILVGGATSSHHAAFSQQQTGHGNFGQSICKLFLVFAKSIFEKKSKKTHFISNKIYLELLNSLHAADGNNLIF